ncbi:MAG TPA: hypothetical protein VK465_08705 [Fibrobacteria bacterium]|nr:hypothetical protein [Geothrix sp.]HLP41571.1 hypothetical protein [Fibrobacteria bacterium]
MAFDSEGLMDFGGGAFAGGLAGAKASGGNPYAIAGGAIAMGAMSYFGGAPQRRLEKKVNKLQVRGMEQDLELGDFQLSEGRRQRARDLEAQARKETFGRLLGEYFARKRGVK